MHRHAAAPLGPLAPLCSPAAAALALLLAVRLGRVYDRWWEARRRMAATGNTAIELVQQAGAFMRDREAQVRRPGAAAALHVQPSCTCRRPPPLKFSPQAHRHTPMCHVVLLLRRRRC